MNAKESKQRSGRWACVTSNAWLDSVKRPHSQREIRVRMWDWEMLSKKKKKYKKNQSDYGEGGSRDIQSMRLKATGMQIMPRRTHRKGATDGFDQRRNMIWLCLTEITLDRH